jgi:hypothetical protein
MTIGLRVSPDEEIGGLDLNEHAANSYPDFAPSAHGVSLMAAGGSELPGTMHSMASAKTTPAEG